MIAKGKRCHHAGNLANYLLEKGENEKVVFHGVQGTVSQDLLGSLKEMEDLAQFSNCKKDFLYSLSVRPKDGESLTPEQWEKTVSAFEKALELEGHQRAIVEHTKDGTSHYHIVWSRIDPETLKVSRLNWSYAKHEEVCRQLEKDFGLEQVAGRFARDPDQARPRYAPDHYEVTEAHKNGYNAYQWRAECRALLAEMKTGPELREALDAKGYILARGDNVEYLLLDPAGNEKRAAGTLGLRVKELRQFFGDIKNQLPTVEQAKQLLRIQQERITSPEQEITKPRSMGEMESAFRWSYIASDSFEAFKADFARRGFTLHRSNDQSPIVALDKEGHIIPLNESQLSRGYDPDFLQQLEAAKLQSVDQEMLYRAELEKAAQPVAVAPEKTVADRLAEMKTEHIQHKPSVPRYQAQGMVAQQNNARSHHKEILRRKAEAEKQAKEEETVRRAMERLEKVAAKQATEAPKPPEQVAKDQEAVRTYYDNKRATYEKEQAAKRAAEIKAAQEKAAREVVAREAAASEKSSEEREAREREAIEALLRVSRECLKAKPTQVKTQQEKNIEQGAKEQTTKRRAEEQREAVQAAAPPRQTQAQALAAHKAKTTEQTDSKQKTSVFSRLYSVTSKGGKENAYDYDRER